MKRKKNRERNKNLLLILNRPSNFCCFFWLQQAEGVGFRFSPFLWFFEDGGQVWDELITVAQPPTQFCSLLLDPQYPSVPGQCLQSTSCVVLEVNQLVATHMPPSRSSLS